MARKRKEDAEKTRKRILASALSLFTKDGYENTTFTDIAARLKMTKGAVYWHFKSKEQLLVALVDLAFERFEKQMESAIPAGELTYPAVAKMMVKLALSLVEDPRAAAFFRLLKCQVKWGDASMEKLRKDLLTNERFGPKEAFRKAIANDIAAGRIRSTVAGEEVASVSIALWDGLVQSRIDKFLSCDIAETLSHAYEAIWERMKNKELRT